MRNGPSPEAEPVMVIPEPVMLPYPMTSTQNRCGMWRMNEPCGNHVYIKINKKAYIYEITDCPRFNQGTFSKLV